jgi:acetylglutamate kinase
MSIRETVLKSLSAVGAEHEAKFYAEVFARQDAETFAMIVIDPRCLKDPLLEALIAALRILSNLELSPVLIVGAMDDARTKVKFQAQRLSRDLDRAGVRATKLNTASYGLIAEMRKIARAGRMPIMEMTDRRGEMNLAGLVKALLPKKIIFLQPSGGLTVDGRRRTNLTVSELPSAMESESFSAGQIRFLNHVLDLEKSTKDRRSYVIASPLNLLGELFTTQGSGTLIRRAIQLNVGSDFKAFSKEKLGQAIENAFEKRLKPSFLKKSLLKGFVDSEYRGGALFTEQAGVPYLSKFFVLREARGEGIARDIWDTACGDMPSFIWRSRMGNPFNPWYMRKCDGMQRTENASGDWRVFWKGLDASEIGDAIIAAATAPDDFES